MGSPRYDQDDSNSRLENTGMEKHRGRQVMLYFWLTFNVCQIKKKVELRHNEIWHRHKKQGVRGALPPPIYCDVPRSPCLSKKGESNVQFVHLWTDQMSPGPVSCRCPGGSLETPPRCHATILFESRRVQLWAGRCHVSRCLSRFLHDATHLLFFADGW